MPNVYQQLCPVLFGAGAADALPEKVQELGGGPVLIICDAGIRAATSLLQSAPQDGCLPPPAR